MINVSDATLYQFSLVQLSAYKRQIGREHRGRFVQIFLALKFYQNQMPSMFSGQFASIEVIQQLLDDLYTKASRPANNSVLMLFRENYLARTGLIGIGRHSQQNTWRNHLHLQKPIVCYAPPQDLASQTFLNEPRVNCRYLSPSAPNTLAGAKCSLCPSGAAYRGEDNRKWLRIDPHGNGYAVVDMLNISNFLPYVAPNGHRIPIVPLIVALYHDAISGLVTSSRVTVDTTDFASDFNFSASELQAYFDDDVTNPYNAALLAQFQPTTYTPFGNLAPVAAHVPAQPAPPRFARALPIPQPVPAPTPAPPPLVNTGWDAEQYVAAVLTADGWTVHDVSRQRVGYDLWVQKGRETRYVDVKSSLGYCTPALTAREWQQARTHGTRYVLAIVENFSPSGTNIIYWVPNPAAITTARESTIVQYAIPRTAWLAGTVPLVHI